MLIYIILFLIISFNVYRFDIKKQGSERQRIQAYHLCALLLIIVSSLSYRVGIDSTRYEEAFGHYPTLAEFKLSDLKDFNNEPLWVLLNIIVKTLFNSWVIVKFITMTSFTMSLFYFIRHSTKYIFTSVLLFYFISWLPYCFETLRQTMALSFFLWGLVSLFEGDVKKYLKRAWPMILFHHSGIVPFLLTLCFTKIKVTKGLSFFILILFALSAVFSDYMYNFANIINLISAETAEEMMRSFANEKYGLKSQNIVGFIVHGVLYVIPSVLLSCHYYINRKYIISNVLILFSMFSIFSYSWIICFRFADYFRIVYYVALSDFLLNRSYVNKSLITKYICSIAMILLVYMNSNSLFNSTTSNKTSLDVRYFPYHSVLTEKKDPYREQYISESIQFETLYN